MNDWIEWNGGECPVAGEVRTDIRFRIAPGEEEGCTERNRQASYYRWDHNGGYGDIVAYRLVDAPRAPTDGNEWARAVQSALSTQVGGNHYKGAAIQPVEFCVKNKLESLESAIVKRAFRHDKPTGKGREDVEKIIHEAQLLLELKYGAAA